MKLSKQTNEQVNTLAAEVAVDLAAVTRDAVRAHLRSLRVNVRSYDRDCGGNLRFRASYVEGAMCGCRELNVGVHRATRRIARACDVTERIARNRIMKALAAVPVSK